MKIFHRFLFIAVCVFIICNKSCFCEINSGKLGAQKSITNSGLCLLRSDKSADEVIVLADRECAEFNYKKAIRLYEQALRLNPSDTASVYLKMGICYVNSGKYKKSVCPLTKSIEINPDNSSALYYRGSAYYEMKDWDEAKRDLKKALEINNFSNLRELKEANNLSEHIDFLESAE